MSEQECPFCKIETQGVRILWQNRRFVVILSNPRLMAGHTLVIPRRHVGAPFELNIFTQIELLWIVLKWQRKLIRIFSQAWDKPAGCDVSWHTRPFMPQTQLSIPGHAHVHLRPRYWSDPYYEAVLKHETPFFQDAKAAERAQMRDLLGEP